MENYKSARNHCVSFIKNAKSTYYVRNLNKGKTNSNELWRHLHEFASKDTKTVL